jgi:hypothetical protein
MFQLPEMIRWLTYSQLEVIGPMANSRLSPVAFVRLFLVLAGVILMLISFAMAWWSVEVSFLDIGFGGTVKIFGYGLRHTMEGSYYLADDVTPLYQSILAWGYIGAAVCVALAGNFLKSRVGAFLTGAVGVAHISYVAVTMFVVITNRVNELGFAVLGPSVVVYPAGRDTTVSYLAGLEPGYYLAYVAGGILVVSALLHYITAKKSPSFISGTDSSPANPAVDNTSI